MKFSFYQAAQGHKAIEYWSFVPQILLDKIFHNHKNLSI